MDNYVIDPDTGCWIWQGSRDLRGDYPYRWVDAQFVSARRWHYEQQHGPIPDGLKLQPQCDQRLCVCPAHMETVAPREIVRGRPSNKLDEAKAREIRALAGQVPQRVIAAKFGISLSHVNQIIRGKSWQDEATPAPVAYAHQYGKLTFADAERIRELAQTTSRKDLAVRYGVSESSISLIVSGKRWAKPQVSTPTHPDHAPVPSDG
jgi:transcriptional regulator with XRE-family HTH domain